jgi:arginine N-succinyltransferase
MSQPKIRLLDIRPVPAPLPQEEGGNGLWVCAETGDGRLLAALQVQPALGHSRPRYSFHLGRVVHAAPELGLHQVQTTLQLGHDATGEAEFSGLYLAPELTNSDAGDALLDDLLQLALAQLPRSANGLVVVELPGWREPDGRSPFWDGLVRQFLPAGAPDAGQLMSRFGPGFASHLGALLPRQLIHATFLPQDAQEALGRCDAGYEPWRRALLRAGFADWRHCRIEDGGPVWARSVA